MGGTWTVALRIARRSALTAWGRSLLIVALIAAPIIGLTGGAVLLASTQSTLDERIRGNLAHAEAKLTAVGGPGLGIRQGVEGGSDYTQTDQDSSDWQTVDPRPALPATARTIEVDGGAATFATPAGSVSLQVETGRPWDPVLDGGPYALLSGRRPATAEEVLLSPAAITRLGAHVGGTIRALDPARTLTVVGTLADRGQPSSTPLVFGADAIAADTDPIAYWVTGTPIDWATVHRLNARGTTAFSRAVVTHPPADAPDFSGGGGFNPSTTIAITLAVLFAVFEVSLLTGSAFLVGARLQQRSMAMIASVGADRAVLRRVVTANGVVLGAIGGVAGVALGIAAAAVFIRITDDGTWSRYPGLHLQWPVLAGIAAFGIAVGWVAALIPSRAASRFDVVRALRGARTPQRIGKRPALGMIALTLGVVGTLAGGGALLAAMKTTGDQTVPVIGAVALLGGGAVVAQVGVMLCTGLVLRGVAAAMRRGPLAARLAARDTARNLGRAVPAVASVMTTVFLAAFVMCFASATSADAAANYSWELAKPGAAEAWISRSNADGVDAAFAERWVDTVRQDLPVRDALVIGDTVIGSDDPTPSNRARDAQAVVRPESAICSAASMRNRDDPRCGPYSAVGGRSWSSMYALTVGDPAALALLLGHPVSAEALATLDRGGAVALRTGLDAGGRLRLDWLTPKQIAGDSPETAKARRTSTLPVVVDLPANPVQTALFVTPATAARLGTTWRPQAVLLDLTRTPTDRELDTANTALSALANEPGVFPVRIETGPQDYGSQIAWGILIACLVIAVSAGATAIGLARVDGRADDATLASLGAAPRIRKAVAFVQALIVCGVGAVVGTLLGLLPAIALGSASGSLRFAPPVLQLVLTAVGIPVVIAAGAWLLVGTRPVDLTRRTAMA